MAKPRSVDDNIAALPDAIQQRLDDLRQLCRLHAPQPRYTDEVQPG